MSEIPEFVDRNELERIAEESGLAIAIADGTPRDVLVSNNNSICQNLNPSGKFSPACAEFCGKAVENAFEAGKTIGFECHAGLECRAVRITNSEIPLVAIVGRTFLKAENYRRATERAISGDWSQYSPDEFFENILLTGSQTVLERAAAEIESLMAVEPVTPAKSPPKATSRPIKKAPQEPITDLVEKFNREVGLEPKINPDPEPRPAPMPKTPRTERRTAEAQVWRSFFSSLLKIDYSKATDAILEFLAHQYGFSALIWLEKNESQLENTAAFGEMKNRKVRLGIASDDKRLVEASQNDKPLELGERAKSPTSEALRTMNLFPIGVGGDISAAIAILDPIGDEAVKTHIARICHSIAAQLEILRLRDEVARGESLATAVRRFSESLKRVDSDDLWLNLTQNAAEMLRAERASLLIFDEKDETLAIKALIGAKSSPASGEEIGGRVSKIVFAKSKAVAVADVSKTGLPPAPADRGYKTSSFLSCPISISGRTIGVMNFADRACGLAFDKSALELFHAIAPQLAVAIDRASLKEKAGEFEQLSVTDALTGLLNRRYMEARLMEEIKRSNRHGFPMSFMMLDVDHFKTYNDQFGHPAGDEALKLIGHVIRETLRGADVAARFGGEEFAILLPQTTGEEASTIAERIRGNIEHSKFPHRRVTASIGVANCSAELCLSADLVSAADKALYEAKRRGRNRVLTFEEMKGVRLK